MGIRRMNQSSKFIVGIGGRHRAVPLTQTHPLHNEKRYLVSFGCLVFLLTGILRSAAVEADPGWQKLSNTRLMNACPSPSPGGSGGCATVISAWGGAAARTKAGREQLIIWGG